MSIPKTSSLSPLKAINQLLKLFYNALSFIVNAILAALGRRNRNAFVSVKLTADISGVIVPFSAPVVVSNQFRTLGTITTNSQGIGSGRFDVVSGRTFNFEAVFSGNMAYESSVVYMSGIK